MNRAKGELESELLNALRDAEQPLTVKELQAGIPRSTPAVTTIITVLERMRAKGFVDRESESGRSFRYFATRSRVDQATDSIHQALDQAGDRQAALMLLAGSLTTSDRELLRKALRDSSPNN